jgi:acyl-CoA thioesterase-1
MDPREKEIAMSILYFPSFFRGRVKLTFLLPLLLLTMAASPLFAQDKSIRVVALGASNTAGKGVGAAAAWPAQLEAMLRAKGYDARVVNAGVNGNNTRQMRARLPRVVAPGTHIVVLERAGHNDTRDGVDTFANISAMTTTLEKMGVGVIVVGNKAWSNWQLQRDGIHITSAGHRAIADKLLPLVLAAAAK